MADGLRWWVIPGALVILARAVTLPPREATVPVAPAAASRSDDAQLVRVQDASGSRQELTLPVPTAQALFVDCPAILATRRVDMVIWRRIDGVREAEPWLRLRPRVRTDHIVPIAGLPAGHYDVEVRCDEQVFMAQGVSMPGAARLSAAQ